MGAGKGLLKAAEATKGLPVGMSIKDVSDDTLRIYRGSYDDVPYYEVVKDYSGDDIYGGVFGSASENVASSHGGGAIHFTDIPKNEILTHYQLNYVIPDNDVKKALKNAAPNLDKNNFDDLYRIVIADEGQDLYSLSESKLKQLFGTTDFGEANNEAQKIRGKVSKNLGYKAIEMSDEGGTSYLVAPGAKFNKLK
jgi:hypothetical protein